MNRSQNPIGRSGGVLPLVVLLFIPLLVLVAFVIDYGYVVQVRSQLQNAADAAAMAGASQLFDRDELKGKPNQGEEIAAVRAEAAMFARLNKGGGIDLVLDANDDNEVAGDTVVGYLASPADQEAALEFNTYPLPSTLSPRHLFSSPTMPGLGLFWLPQIANPPIPFITPPPVSSSYNSYNSVQVRVRRDSTRNGSLNLFFGTASGQKQVDLQAMATATHEDNIRGFKIYPNGPTTSKLLPFAMDVNTYAAMAAGLSVLDLYKYDPTGPATLPRYPGTPPNYKDRVSMADLRVGNVLTDPRLNPLSSQFAPSATTLAEDLLPGDGIKEALLVPLAIPAQTIPLVGPVSVGNFGTVYIGNRARSNYSEFQRQVLYGPNADDFADMGGKLQLGPDGTLTMRGDPLIGLTIKSLLGSVKGQPRIIPLYRPKSDTLTLAGLFGDLLGEREYTIVGFGGIVILDILEIPATPAVTIPLTGIVLIPAGEISLKLLVQPEFVIDGTAIGGGATLTNGGAKSSRFIYRPARLTR